MLESVGSVRAAVRSLLSAGALAMASAVSAQTSAPAQNAPPSQSREGELDVIIVTANKIS